jgi:hypothetical protein
VPLDFRIAVHWNPQRFLPPYAERFAEELSAYAAQEYVTDVRSSVKEKLGDGDRVLPGEGVLPLAEFRDAILSTGYEGDWSLELLNEELWRMDPMEVASPTAISHCRRGDVYDPHFKVVRPALFAPPNTRDMGSGHGCVLSEPKRRAGLNRLLKI